jgi:hypothetical protein
MTSSKQWAERLFDPIRTLETYGGHATIESITLVAHNKTLRSTESNFEKQSRETDIREPTERPGQSCRTRWILKDFLFLER